MAVNSDRRSAVVIVPATKKRMDRELAEALHQFLQPVTSLSESQQSIRKVVIEIFAWIASAAFVWSILAFAL